MSTMTKVAILLGLLAGIVFGASRWYGGVVEDAVDRGKITERAVWEAKEMKRKADELDAILANQETNRLIQKANDAKNLKVAQDHEKIVSQLKSKIASIDAGNAAAGGLRIPRSICDSVAAQAETTGNPEHDAYLAGTVQLPSSIERFLNSEADRADEKVEVARECQNWVRAHGFYDDPKLDDSRGDAGGDLGAQPSRESDPL